MVRLILMIIIVGLLTACSGVMPPTSSLVQKAIALQLNLARQPLSQLLDYPPSAFKITQVQITDTEPLVIGNLPSYHIRGTYNLTLKLPRRQLNQTQNPFDVYLQRQIEGKTWRLAHPQLNNKDSDISWLTYSIEY